MTAAGAEPAAAAGPGRFGPYGGCYAPETLMEPLAELERTFAAAVQDRAFLDDFAFELARWVGRPTPLTPARRLSEQLGLRVYLKREDLAHTGAHKINNSLGQCLLARRFIEAGVRFVEITHGNWDQHVNLSVDHKARAEACDKPIAGLLQDLKQRDMLKDTLVIWGGEFGRTPAAQGGDGRNHNNKGYTTWMAGGGVKGGFSYGSTDEHGYEAVEDKCHIHDWHATILQLPGLDHARLSYRCAGRDFRLTDVAGEVARDILA